METQDPLVVFLYVLLRDELPFGTLNGIVKNHVQKAMDTGGGLLSSVYLGELAKELADKLRTDHRRLE